MKRAGKHIAALSSGIMFFILVSFVPAVLTQIMDLLNKGAEPGTAGWVAIFWAALLGTMMYLSGRFFRAYDKKVEKYFDSFFDE